MRAPQRVSPELKIRPLTALTDARFAFTATLNLPGRSQAANVNAGSWPELVKGDPLAGSDTSAVTEISGRTTPCFNTLNFTPTA